MHPTPPFLLCWHLYHYLEVLKNGYGLFNRRRERIAKTP
jgi:hypothetical protein